MQRVDRDQDDVVERILGVTGRPTSRADTDDRREDRRSKDADDLGHANRRAG